ncbi:serine protease [Candidatus Uhrbacteria bacterium]|nr:serine protease [Candidatus Uhrbacteria bacterium]
MKKSTWPHTIRIILFSCLIGGAAGVITTALTTSYLSEYALELNDLTEPLRLTQERPRALPKDYADALDRIEERALPTIGSLVKQSLLVESGVSVFALSTPVIALTSDGWALSSAGRVGDVVSWNGLSCEVDEVMSEPMFGFEFIHCATSNVPVIDIAGGYGVQAGDQVFVVNSQSDLLFTRVRSVEFGEAVRVSDLPSRRIILAQTESVVSGSAVFNVYGELVGITRVSVEGTEVIPFEHFSGAFTQVLEAVSVITYPALGVRGIDLAHAIGVSEDLARGHHTGFVLYGVRAVERGGAGSNAGLLEGDILLSVEGVPVNKTKTLDDLIAYYGAGDQIRIEIDRGGSTQEVVVTLGELTL